MAERKSLLLRLDPAVHDALQHWASDELRSTNAQIAFLLRQALANAGRLPAGTGRLPRRGRPPGAAATQVALEEEEEHETRPGPQEI